MITPDIIETDFREHACGRIEIYDFKIPYLNLGIEKTTNGLKITCPVTIVVYCYKENRKSMQSKDYKISFMTDFSDNFSKLLNFQPY